MGGLLICFATAFVVWQQWEPSNNAVPHAAGDPLDSLNGVVVFYNAGIGNVSGRNVVDGYNVGLKYQ